MNLLQLIEQAVFAGLLCEAEADSRCVLIFASGTPTRHQYFKCWQCSMRNGVRDKIGYCQKKDDEERAKDCDVVPFLPFRNAISVFLVFCSSVFCSFVRFFAMFQITEQCVLLSEDYAHPW